jgi:hypothetical protein
MGSFKDCGLELCRLSKERPERVRRFLGTTAVISLLALPTSSLACSMLGCLDKGTELRLGFVVKVTYRDKPLLGLTRGSFS